MTGLSKINEQEKREDLIVSYRLYIDTFLLSCLVFTKCPRLSPGVIRCDGIDRNVAARPGWSRRRFVSWAPAWRLVGLALPLLQLWLLQPDPCIQTRLAVFAAGYGAISSIGHGVDPVWV